MDGLLGTGEIARSHNLREIVHDGSGPYDEFTPDIIEPISYKMQQPAKISGTING